MKKLILILAMILFGQCATFEAKAVVSVNVLSQIGSIYEVIINNWTEDGNTPNPCYGETSCYVGVDVQYFDHNPGMYGVCIESHHCLTNAGQYATTQEVLAAYSNQVGLSNMLGINAEGSTIDCAALFYITQQPDTQEHVARIWPGSACTPLHPNTACKLIIPDTIDFGTVNNSQIKGLTKHISAVASCTKSATLNFYLASDDQSDNVMLNADNTLWAIMAINDQSAVTGATAEVVTHGSASFDVSATLNSSKNIAAGSYSGVAALVLTFE